MTGKTVGSIRRTLYDTPAGSVGNTWTIADSTCKVAAIMSVPQAKLTEMSQLPRLVLERMLRTAGTLRTAPSTGRVTSITMRSAGRSPASTLTTMRGNETCGNSPTGRRLTDATPPTARTKSRKRTERRCSCSQATRLMGGRAPG